MHILKKILFISCIVEASFAILKNCSSPHTQPSICFKDETGYSKPFPTILNIGVNFKDIIEIDEQRNSINIQMELITFWRDPRLALSNGEIEG